MLRQSERQKIVKLTQQGKSRKEVAETMGVSVATVNNILRPLGLLDNFRVTSGKRGAVNKVLESGFGNP